MAARPFWIDKPLSQLNTEEWEALCDGCARCCLHKVEDEETNELLFTRIACRLLDVPSCRCTDYANRCSRVPECLDLSPCDPQVFAWLPKTCAYRLRAESKPLPEWHPLITGDPDSVHEADASVREWAVSESDVDEDDDEAWAELVLDGYDI